MMETNCSEDADDAEANEDLSFPEDEIMKATYKWSVEIPHVDNVPTMEKIVESPIFATKFNKDITWKLQITQDDRSDAMSLYLYLISSNISKMQVFYRCWIVSRSRRRININKSMFHADIQKARVSGIPNFASKSILNDEDCFRFGKLTIICKIDAITRNFCVCAFRPEATLAKNLASLLKNEKFADVTLVATGGKKFKAHKAILATRSPVFARMFEHDMLEKRQNVVKIDDVDRSVMRELLRFVYTGKLENLEANACGLMAAAEKYQLEEIKAVCVDTLLKNLTIENAIGVLVLADRYNVAELKARVIDFVNVHAREVISTPAFKSLSKAQAHLITEAYCVLATALSDSRDLKRGCKYRKTRLFDFTRPRRRRVRRYRRGGPSLL